MSTPRFGFTAVRERGHDSDSSSSRETSPQPTLRRPPLTNPDDLDPEVPPIDDDDTPQPPERPLIRQPVGFTNFTSKVNLNTYQAAPALADKDKAPTFLPGQEVAAPEPPQKKKETRKRKKKHTDAFSEQVSRWRIKEYDPAASTAPPTSNGRGPYSSLYRATSEASDARPAPSKRANAKGKGKAKERTPRGYTASKSPSPSVGAPSATPSYVGDSSSASTPLPTTASSTLSALPAPPSRAPQDHYRRNYEKDGSGLGLAGLKKGSSEVASAGTSAPKNGLSFYRQHTEATNTAIIDPSKRPRIVTILITDVRSGQTDNQLAEVKIPVSPMRKDGNGFWADSYDLCTALQEGPSRIDGPAKVYTFRGKYRHFFMRVTDDNRDEVTHTNLSISSERTIEIVVELGPRPGQIPGPPMIPANVRPSPSPEPEPEPYPYARPGPSLSGMLTDPYNDSKKRRRESLEYEHQSPTHPPPPVSPSYPASNPYMYPPPGPPAYAQQPGSSRLPYGPNTYLPSSPSHKRMRPESDYEVQQSVYRRPLAPDVSPISGPPAGRRERLVDPRQKSPDSDDDDDEVFKKIVKRVDRELQKEEDWKQWFMRRGRPQSVPIIMFLYRFAQHLFDKYEGKRVPFKTESLDYRIARRHILFAMQMKENEDPDGFAARCSETLDLLKLYGPEGSRLQSPEVKAMMEDDKPPAYNANLYKRFLHILRDIDKQWKADHGELEATVNEPVPSDTSVAHSPEHYTSASE